MGLRRQSQAIPMECYGTPRIIKPPKEIDTLSHTARLLSPMRTKTNVGPPVIRQDKPDPFLLNSGRERDE